MGKLLAIERRQLAERLYVQEGVTALTRLQERTGISRPTLTKMKMEGQWEKKRSEHSASPDQLADRVKTVLAQLLDEIDEKLKDKEFVAPELVKRLDSYSRTLLRLNGMFYSKGMMMQWANQFLDFVVARPEHSKLLPGLRKVMPEFFDHIEKGM